MHSAHWAPEDERWKYFFICRIAMTSKLEMTLLLDFQRQRCYSTIKVTSNINVSLVLEWIYISHLLFDISYSERQKSLYSGNSAERAKSKIYLGIFTTSYRKYCQIGPFTVTETTLKQRIICHAKQSKNKIKILPVLRRQSVHSTLVHRCSFSLLFWPVNQ